MKQPKLIKPKIIKNKDFLVVLKHIENIVGENGTGIFISVLADSLDKFMEGKEEAEIRSIEITYNDFFSHKAVLE